MTLIVLTALAAFPSTAAAATPPAGPMPAGQAFGATLDLGYCYDYLAPYGTWLDLDPYGYVWCPRNMGYGWRPYTEGQWIWSDYGWNWDSDLDWGWMPFHYGRWGWDNDCGWFWAPGTEWGPAWVFWRSSDLYFGWAPIPPGIAFGAGVDFDALALGLPLNFWVFVDGGHFLDRDLGRYALPYERNRALIGQTEFRNRYEFRGGRMIDEGIGVDHVQRLIGRRVTRYTLADADRPGGRRLSGDRAMVYRPEIRQDSQARPRQLMNRDEARREMGAARVYEPRRGAPAVAPESAVRKRQAEERALLERSQAQDRQNMQRRQAEESRRIQNQAERAQVEQRHRAQMAEQQRQHQAERQQMNERHQREAERVRQSPPPQPQRPRKK
jgi:hypothetical protein